jgi:zinc/manganese transport system substrate-binding protein
MRRRSLVSLIAVGVVSAVVHSRPAGAAPRLHVVATVGDLGAIAREVLGDAGDVVVLARPTQDPHFVDARPNLILDLNRADVLLSMGLDYEVGWLPVLVRGSRNPRIQIGAPGNFVASSVVPLLEVPHGHVDRAMGDIHPGGNPHFTLDPRNAVRIARALGTVFGGLAPENRPIYERNASAFAAQIEAREKVWEASFAPYKGTAVVTYHKSFAYFVSWLGLTEAGTIEPKPGIPPNAAHVAELVGAMRAQHVPVILQERWYPSNVAERIASQTGARLVLISGMTPDGGRYADHIDEVVRAVVGALAAARGGQKP